MFPSPADSDRMDTSGSTSPRAITSSTFDHQRASTGLYPDLSLPACLVYEEGDVLGAKPKNRPARPPPPRANSFPAKRSNVISGNLADLTKPNIEEIAPLYPHEVRWFYKAPGKYWQPLQGCDSLLLEQTYLSLNGGGQASAGDDGGLGGECSDGVCEGEVVVLGGLYEVDVVRRTLEPIYWKAKEEWKVLRGYWFEAAGDKWYPFQEEDYAVIEEEHLKKDWRIAAERDLAVRKLATSCTTAGSNTEGKGAGGSKDDPASLDCGVVLVHKLSLEKCDIQWLSNGDIYQMKKEFTAHMWNIVGEKLGKGSQFGATKLARGYKEPASSEDRPSSIGHLVFVVHGIGQNLDMTSIEKSSSDFREVIEKVAKKNFSEGWNNKRVEFIPVDWRTGLTLDAGMVSKVTLQGLKKVRDIMNSSANDILYYLSPVFGPELLSGLRLSLQKQYNKFIRRHPHFLLNGGTVSVIGHSLGSVLMFDLLREKGSQMCSSSSYDNVCNPFSYPSIGEECDLQSASSPQGFDSADGFVGMFSKQSEIREEIRRLKERVSVLEHHLASKELPVLSFCIDHFFAFGSPLGLFIAMKADRNLIVKEHRGSSSMIPTSVCKRLHNVHHPSDPIAFRLEPLINPLYSQVKPVKIDFASKKISKDSVSHAEGPMTDDDLKDIHQQQQGKSWWSGLANMKQSIVTMASSKLPISAGNMEAVDAPATTTKSPMPDKMIDSDKKFHPDERLKERLDFVLREGMVENSYLNALTAHLSYWNSSDVAQYLLLQLYKYKST